MAVFFQYRHVMDAPQHIVSSWLQQLNTVVLGKEGPIRDAVVCLLAGGHLLIEDRPGVGKTTLAQALAQTLGLAFARVQFTADLMPSDLTGVSVFDRERSAFVFHPGPVFTQVLLADEINRASPRTQSALLEAMEEGHVSAEGQTRALPQPFFVIATQNPTDEHGTQALPASQLDRFLMRVHLGYPNWQAERALLRGQDRRALLRTLPTPVQACGLATLQAAVREVQVSEAWMDQLQHLLEATRNGTWFAQGLSPRAGMGLLRAAQARALMEGRGYTIPEDLAALLPALAAHRLRPLEGSGHSVHAQLQALLQSLRLA
jgi:MoxR-like ATPase